MHSVNAIGAASAPHGPWRRRLWQAALTAALTIAGAGPGLAQAASPPPSLGAGAGLSSLPTIDRDRQDRTLPTLPKPTPAPFLPSPSAQISANVPVVATLTHLRFEGASLPTALLDKAVAGLLGRPLSAETLKAIAAAVGDVYAKSDIAYYSVVIPPQVPTGGLLVLRITEGAVTQYTLNGHVGGKAKPRLAAQIRKILHDRPLHKSTLERTISLMRDLPGQTVNAQIRQIDTNGALVIDLVEHRKSVNIALTLNNDGVANVTSAFQMQVAATAYNLVRDGDQTTVSSYLPIHPERYQLYSGSHTTLLGENGLSLNVNGAYLRTRSRDRTTIGTAKLAGVGLSYPIIRSSKTNLSASLSLDGINSSNYFLDTRFGDYRSRAVRAGLSWSRSDDKNGYALSAVVSRGLDGLGAKAFVGFSENQFTKLNLQGVAVRSLSKTLVVKLTTRGQYSQDKLPVTERAAIGGPGAGRAFQIGTVTGDKAATGMIEVAWTPAIKSKALGGSGLFAFIDGGTARTVARPFYGLPAESYSLASAGGGVRLTVAGKWRASVEVAVPVKRPAAYYSRKPQVFFGFGRSF